MKINLLLFHFYGSHSLAINNYRNGIKRSSVKLIVKHEKSTENHIINHLYSNTKILRQNICLVFAHTCIYRISFEISYEFSVKSQWKTIHYRSDRGLK